MHFGMLIGTIINEIEDIVGFISIIFMLHALISLLFSEFLFDIFNIDCVAIDRTRFSLTTGQQCTIYF